MGLKLCTGGDLNAILYRELHALNSRATSHQLMIYKHSILLHRLVNNMEPDNDWLILRFMQTCLNWLNLPIIVIRLNVKKHSLANRLKTNIPN